MYTKPETEERRRLGRTYENKHAKYCFCSDNKLESLPENIFSNMPALHTVILSRNSFTVLHEGPWRPMLHQLSSINLEGKIKHSSPSHHPVDAWPFARIVGYNVVCDTIKNVRKHTGALPVKAETGFACRTLRRVAPLFHFHTV